VLLLFTPLGLICPLFFGTGWGIATGWMGQGGVLLLGYFWFLSSLWDRPGVWDLLLWHDPVGQSYLDGCGPKGKYLTMDDGAHHGTMGQSILGFIIPSLSRWTPTGGFGFWIPFTFGLSSTPCTIPARLLGWLGLVWTCANWGRSAGLAAWVAARPARYQIRRHG